MSNAATLGIDPAFEAMIVEYCAAAVSAGREMTKDLMLEAMNASLRRQMSFLDRADVVRAVSDATYTSIRAKGGIPKCREITQAVIDAAPADARSLLSKFRSR
jgi:hypothetical protein